MSGPGTGTRPPLAVRLAVVTVGALLIWSLMAALSAHAYPDAPGLLRHVLNAAVVFVLAVPLVILARRYLDHGSLGGLGLTGPRTAWWPLLAGALAWLIPGLAGCGGSPTAGA